MFFFAYLTKGICTKLSKKFYSGKYRLQYIHFRSIMNRSKMELKYTNPNNEMELANKLNYMEFFIFWDCEN